jgi:hypothetical protein
MQTYTISKCIEKTIHLAKLKRPKGVFIREIICIF